MNYQTVFITGATKGLGRALVIDLCSKGYKVFATGRDETQLQQLMQQTGCLGVSCDLSQAEAAVEIFQKATKALGHIDVLINNAGMNSRKCELAETTLEEFEQQYAVNLRAPYLLCREAMQQMLPKEHGYIINIVSTAAKRSNPTMSIYSAMKQGFAGLNNVLMKEAQPHGIKVTAVYPGGMNTAFREQERPQYMQPASVATLVSQLLSNPIDVVIHELTCRPMVELE
ncbi:short-chain dehydrogenase/reductase SDR [Psychromonas ingrahamii 37]|uniref:Short-chain dehydrogenase/reductase SDR n=1 Tax=Psychromonas ingrahamii (strain DSM 17664 / CCUG 51855 / 37) TaxID=357804 RepID=A1SRH5_PSYIN|nr:SDR family oxidoreductase [Psychromonas ingrahamii]ABM02090.1 short-chain dehydrogenase/reductase SDR [Psychromonas ingrahamii 37]